MNVVWTIALTVYQTTMIDANNVLMVISYSMVNVLIDVLTGIEQIEFLGNVLTLQVTLYLSSLCLVLVISNQIKL